MEENLKPASPKPAYEKPAMVKVPVPGVEGANPAQLCSSGALAAQLLRMRGNCKAGGSDGLNCLAGLLPGKNCNSGGSDH
jgi:hypothetical protein